MSSPVPRVLVMRASRSFSSSNGRPLAAAISTTAVSPSPRTPHSASLEAEWSELARLRADPNVFLTPDWIRVARAYDRREQITLWIAERGIAALALEDDGTISFAGGEYTDYQDVVAKPVDVPVVAESLAAWIAVRRSPRAIFEFVPEDSGTLDALSAGLGRAGYEVRPDRLVTPPRLTLSAR